MVTNLGASPPTLAGTSCCWAIGRVTAGASRPTAAPSRSAGRLPSRCGNGPLSLSANTSSLFADAQNTATGTIQANGGQALLMARDSRPASPLQVVVNNAGLIEAGTLQARQGRIVLDGGSGMVLAGGRMSASALAHGDGGSVSIRGGHVSVLAGAQVDTRASNGNTGTLDIRGDALKVSESAAITATSWPARWRMPEHNERQPGQQCRRRRSERAGKLEQRPRADAECKPRRRRQGRGQRRLTASGAGTSLNLSADRLIDISQRITLSGVSNQIHLRTTQSGTASRQPPTTC